MTTAVSMIARFSGEAGREKLVEALGQQPIVGGDGPLAHRLASRGQLVEFNAGDTLCKQDDCDDNVFLLLNGSVEILVNGQRVATRSNDLVGEMAAIDPTARRSATVKAITSVVALKLSAEEFKAAGADSDAFQRYLAQLPGERLRERAKFHLAPNQTPIMFVGSSKEGLPVAREIDAALKYDDGVIVRLWTSGGVFGPSRIPVDDLLRQVDVADFALFVFGPDDKIQSRDASHATPRDNVIFEMGLFMGRLGRERVFMVQEVGVDLKIPSDLTGVSPITYKPKNGGTMSEAIGPACTELRREIAAKGAIRNRMRADP